MTGEEQNKREEQEEESQVKNTAVPVPGGDEAAEEGMSDDVTEQAVPRDVQEGKDSSEEVSGAITVEPEEAAEGAKEEGIEKQESEPSEDTQEAEKKIAEAPEAGEIMAKPAVEEAPDSPAEEKKQETETALQEEQEKAESESAEREKKSEPATAAVLPVPGEEQHEEIDFHALSREDILEHFHHHLKKVDITTLMGEIEDIVNAFREKSEQEESSHQSDEEQPIAADPLEGRFKELMNLYKDKKKDFLEHKKAEETHNLQVKEDILAEFRKLIEDEEKIAKAFDRFRELQKKWHETGPVPRRHAKRLEGDHHYVVELFYYNIKINKDLKDLDLHKNLEQKEEVIQKIKDLLNEKSIKHAEHFFRQYRDEWSKTGPVPRARKDELNEAYSEANKALYLKIREHYDKVREQHLANLEAKKELIQKVRQVMDSLPKLPKKWKDKTDRILAIQKEWRAIGFATRSEHEKVWKEFRAVCDEFFNKKKAFFAELRKEQDKNRDRKLALCEKAEAVKDDTNWKNTTQYLIDLQKQWKQVGPAFHKDENALWQRFRGTCDAFFNAKKKFYDTLGDRQEENIKQKEAVIKKIEDTELTGKKDEDLKTLRALAEEWTALNTVPLRNKKEVFEKYTKAMDAKYDQLQIDKQEKQIHRFKNKVERMGQSGDPDETIRRERSFLRNQISRLESTIEQYENNMGFFAASKNVEPLKKEIEKKISKAREEIALLREKVKLLPQQQTKPKHHPKTRVNNRR